MKNKLFLLAACIAAIPRPAFGGADSDAPAYKDTGVPLHGSTDQNQGDPGTPRDQSGLRDKALGVSGQTSEAGPVATDLENILARAREVQEGGTNLSKPDIVRLRVELQRFRQDDPERVDAEINRLEAIILGMKVD